uniref:MD-2-related lipid-recognition domain-containing protein n=2 Tax=Stomoxys calcitrans TaxID=35570 RepID=A0A1I8Q3K4_STOCA
MFKLSRTLPQHLEARALISIKGFTRNDTVTFLDVKMNICDLIQHVKYVPLIDQIMNKLRRVTNVPMSCPVKGNTMYNITNLVITDELFPVYAPPIHFNVTINFLDNKKLLALYRLQGTIAKA